MDDLEYQEILDGIVKDLRKAGYDPFVQLIGYYKTGDITCITRKNDAREKMRQISKEQLRRYLGETV